MRSCVHVLACVRACVPHIDFYSWQHSKGTKSQKGTLGMGPRRRSSLLRTLRGEERVALEERKLQVVDILLFCVFSFMYSHISKVYLV